MESNRYDKQIDVFIDIARTIKTDQVLLSSIHFIKHVCYIYNEEIILSDKNLVQAF